MSKRRTTLALGATMCALVAAVMFSVPAPDVIAQVPTVTAERGDDLRAAYANAADVVEGKRVAEASCASCHGPNGASVNNGVPHLAGQRPAYFYQELKRFQSDARGDAAMHGAVKFLNDEALVKVAAY